MSSGASAVSRQATDGPWRHSEAALVRHGSGTQEGVSSGCLPTHSPVASPAGSPREGGVAQSPLAEGDRPAISPMGVSYGGGHGESSNGNVGETGESRLVGVHDSPAGESTRGSVTSSGTGGGSTRGAVGGTVHRGALGRCIANHW